MTICYDFFNYTPRSGSPRFQEVPQVPMPGVSVDDVLGAGTLRAQNAPAPIREFLESSAVVSLWASVTNLCQTNRDVFIERRRSMEFIGKLHASLRLGEFFAQSRPHLRLPGEVASRPHHAGFGERCTTVLDEDLTEEVLTNPLPRCNPRLHQRHENNAEAVLNCFRDGCLQDALNALRHHPDRSEWEQSYRLVVERIADLVELAAIELQYTSKHGEVTQNIDEAFRNGAPNVFKTVADHLGNLSKAPNFVARCLEAAARYHVYNLANQPTEALGVARDYLRAWGGQLDMTTDQIEGLSRGLRLGHAAGNDLVRNAITHEMAAAMQQEAREARATINQAGLNNRLTQTIDAVASIQALFVLADWAATEPVTDPNAHASVAATLDQIQAYVDRADAAANLGGRGFALMRASGASITIDTARVALATNVLKLVVARGPAVASGIITIFKGMDVLGVGLRGNSPRDMARGGLLITSGAMLVVGTLIAGPIGAGLVAASIVVGLLASSLEDAQYPAQQRMLGMLDDVLSDRGGRGHRVSNQERLDNLCATRDGRHRAHEASTPSSLRTTVEQIKQSASGRDSQGRDMGELGWGFWEVNMMWVPDWTPERMQELQRRAHDQLRADGYSSRELREWVYIPRSLTRA